GPLSMLAGGRGLWCPRSAWAPTSGRSASGVGLGRDAERRRRGCPRRELVNKLVFAILTAKKRRVFEGSFGKTSIYSHAQSSTCAHFVTVTPRVPSRPAACVGTGS